MLAPLSRVLFGMAVLAVLATSAFAQLQRSAVVRGTPITPLRIDDGSGAFRRATNAIIGTALDPTEDPMADTGIQLRDLLTNRVQLSTRTDGEGRFAFRSIEPSTYVVEMVMPDHSIGANSEALTIGTGEIIQTVLQLASRTRSFAWWAGSTTSTVMASASSLGVIALDQGVSATEAPGLGQ